MRGPAATLAGVTGAFLPVRFGTSTAHFCAGLGGSGTLAGVGVLAGVVLGFVLARVAGSFLAEVQMPGAIPVIGSAVLLLLAAGIASMMPALRAARVDVMQALRAE